MKNTSDKSRGSTQKKKVETIETGDPGPWFGYCRGRSTGERRPPRSAFSDSQQTAFSQLGFGNLFTGHCIPSTLLLFLLQIFHVGSLNDLEYHKPLLTKFQSFNPRSISVSWEASDFEEFPEVFGLSENDREGPGVTSRAATTRPVRLLYWSPVLFHQPTNAAAATIKSAVALSFRLDGVK